MIEFGEKLKRAREAKGMTQQTLADQLYVTRQAVSRWENGARYPDLLTAKKLSDCLEVSLDELLSGEERSAEVERAPVMQTQRANLIQTALLSIALLSVVLLAVVCLFGMISNGSSVRSSVILFLLYAALAVVFGMGILRSVQDRMTPGRIGGLAAVYFGGELLRELVTLIVNNMFTPAALAAPLWWIHGALAPLCIQIACLVFVTLFYLGHRERRLVWAWLPLGLYALWCMDAFWPYLVYLNNFNTDQLGRAFLLLENSIALAGQLSVAFLLAWQAKKLADKRRAAK